MSQRVGDACPRRWARIAQTAPRIKGELGTVPSARSACHTILLRSGSSNPDRCRGSQKLPFQKWKALFIVSSIPVLMLRVSLMAGWSQGFSQGNLSSAC